jgi:hypothetical protein
VLAIVFEAREIDRYQRHRVRLPQQNHASLNGVSGSAARSRNLLDRRSWLGSSREESRRFRANAGWEIALVLFAPLFALDEGIECFVRSLFGGTQ